MEDQKKVIKTQRAAAEFASVSTRTIRNWLEGGMTKEESGEYIKKELIAFKEHGGKRDLNHIGVVRVKIDFEKRIILDVSLCNPAS